MHQTGVAGREDGEFVDYLAVFLCPVLEDGDARLRGGDMHVNVLQDGIALLYRQGGADPAGDTEAGMHSLGAQRADDLLTEGAQFDSLHRQFRRGKDHPHDVADGRIGIETEDEVRPRQFEEVHAVGLNHLPHVHQLAEQ